MQKIIFLLQNFKNTESAQLCAVNQFDIGIGREKPLSTHPHRASQFFVSFSHPGIERSHICYSAYLQRSNFNTKCARID